ncbi:WD40-repeat-containing domain protein [Paraphysoderma sedebokerense]|nr:WD40-repeat-containing domain protein [Paraphysoderma sedebokerense]
MNQFLVARQLGLHPPSILKSYVQHEKILSLELSIEKELQREHVGPVTVLEIESVENKYMLSGGGDCSIVLWDLDETPTMIDGRLRLRSIGDIPKQRCHRYQITGINWYPFDTGLFTTSSMDQTIKVWDTNSLQEASKFNLREKVFSHHMSSVAQHCLIAAATSDPNVRLCDLRTGGATHSLVGHKREVLSCQWSPRDEYILATGSSDCTIRIWDVRKAKPCLYSLDQHNTGKAATSGQFNSTVTAHSGKINGLKFTGDGLFLVSAGHDEKVRVWDILNHGKNLLVNYGPYIRNSAYQPVYFDVTPHINLMTSSTSHSSIGFPPALLIYPNDDRQILICDLFSGSLVKRLKGGFFGRVGCVRWRDGEEELYSACSDHEILVWTPSKWSAGSRKSGDMDASDSEDDDEEERERKRRRLMEDSWSDEDE